MDFRRRETLVLLGLVALVGAGALAGVVIDRVSGGHETSTAIVQAPVMRRVIPWHAMKAPDVLNRGATWPSLVATVSVSGPAVTGGELRYQITLRNNGVDAVRLRPCPSFEHSIGDAGGKPAAARFLLNCDAIGLLQPEEEVLLEMVLPVPASLPAGEANLLWRMEGGPTTLTLVTVERT